MIRITQLCALISLALAFGATTSLAQLKGTLIAAVNVTSHTLTVENGTVSGSFSAVSDMGNQEVRYGFVLRSKEGNMLGASEPLGTLSLVEKVPQSKQVSYKLPSVYEEANVFLNLSNDAGIVLALVPVGTVPASDDERICTVQSDSVSCTADSASTLIVTAYEGGAQGAAASTQEIALSAKKKTTVAFTDLLKGKDGGRYLVTGTVNSGGIAVESFAQEYTQEGGSAKIVSTSVDALGKTDGMYAYKAVVLSSIFGQATTSVFSISLTAPGCVETKEAPVAKGGVAEIAFSSSCEGGNATIELRKDGAIVDSAETSFATPVETASAANSTMNLVAIASLVLLGILAAAYFFLRRKGGAETPATPPAAETSVGTPGTTVAAVALFALFAVFSPLRAEADTVYLYGSAIFTFCEGAACDPSQNSGSIDVSGSVTYPASVAASTEYTIWLAATNSGGSSTLYGCQDNSSDTWSCDSADVRVQASVAGTSYDIGHDSDLAVIKTAPASGTIGYSATINPWAPYAFGCKPQWMIPNAKCMMYYDTSENSTSGSITVTTPPPAAPTVEVNFSFLERMFKVFALSN